MQAAATDPTALETGNKDTNGPQQKVPRTDPIFRRVWKRQRQAPGFAENLAYLKGQGPKPKNVVDFNHAEESDQVVELDDFELTPEQRQELGVDSFKAFSLKGKDGFVFLSQCLSQQRQAQWLLRCVLNYSSNQEISKTNLHVNNSPELISTMFLDASQTKLRKKLHWATLGSHFDWTNRVYPRDQKAPIPAELCKVTKTLASVVGNSIIPETAIINYYGKGANMGAHKDDSEEAYEAPVVSVSLSCPGVFVLGGDSLDTPPVALFVRAGDALIMGGTTRYAFHGVPCIFPGAFNPKLPDLLRRVATQDRATIEKYPPLQGKVDEDDAYVELIDRTISYITSVRVNFNVRQIFHSKTAPVKQAPPKVSNEKDWKTWLENK